MSWWSTASTCSAFGRCPRSTPFSATSPWPPAPRTSAALGQGYTSNFLNGGVTFWNLARSREIRAEILARGRRHFRTVADDQWVINEVVQTKYFDQLRILPCQFNFRPDFRIRRRNWPSVDTLDGVYLFHNATSMDLARALPGTRAKALLPDLPDDGGPLTERQQFWRRLRTRLSKHIVG